jgi:hypothetical protein
MDRLSRWIVSSGANANWNGAFDEHVASESDRTLSPANFVVIGFPGPRRTSVRLGLRVIHLAIFNQTRADGKFRQFHEDYRLAGECRRVSSHQGVPAPTVGKRQRARRHRGESSERPRLRLSTQSRNVKHGRLVRRDSLQLPKDQQQLSEKVMLCHRRPLAGSSPLPVRETPTSVDVGPEAIGRFSA